MNSCSEQCGKGVLAIACCVISLASFGKPCWKDPQPVGKESVITKLADGHEMRIDVLASDILRVRVKRGDIWTESGMNRYSVLPRSWQPCAFERGGSTIKTTSAELTSTPAGLKFKSRVSAADLDIGVALEGNGFKVRFPLAKDERIYGLGDVCRTNVMRRGAAYEIWVKNVNSYIPIPMAISRNGWGVFMNTTWRHFVDVGLKDPDAMVSSAPEGEIDFYLFCGKDYPALLDAYTRITGRPSLLPAFGYGFTYVCNDNIDDFGVCQEACQFRDRSFPCDVIGLEPGWMSKNYDKTTQKAWHPTRFKDRAWAPRRGNITTGLQRMGFKLSLWLCCDYDLFRYEEQCAAGMARKEGRMPDIAAGVDETWYDPRIGAAREAADAKRMKGRAEGVLVDKGKELPEGMAPWFEHLKKFVQQGAQCFKLDGCNQVGEHPDRAWANGMSDEEAHNLYPLVYGKQMSRGYEDFTGKRSMVYSSGGYAGVQQFVATWAGDTGGGERPCTSLINLGISGHSNQSCDMNPFQPQSCHFGFLQTWSQLNNWAYWLQPWYQDAAKQAIFRDYANLRYRLFPYLYGAAANASRTGWPVMRGLALAYPDDPAYDDCRTTYMLGDSLLVGAFTDSLQVPPGTWHEWRTDAKVVGPTKVAVPIADDWGGALYVKAGAIIPTCTKPRQHIDCGWVDDVTFECWPSADGDAELYEDDGNDLGYRKGEFAITPLSVRTADGTTVFTICPRKGKFAKCPAKRDFTVRFHALAACPAHVLVNGVSAAGVWNGAAKTFIVRIGETSAKGATVELRRFCNRPVLRTDADRSGVAPQVSFPCIGSLVPRTTAEIGMNDFTIGCETVDRNYADFEAYKEYLPRLGLRKIRVQAGWARCEKEKGVLDFAWLDKIIDWAVAHDLEPILCCVFGNPIYQDPTDKGLFARIPSKGEGYEAWRRWIDTLAKHFAGRVKYYETWNEPNNVPGNTPEIIARNNIETAEIVRRHIPNAVISGMVLGRRNEYEDILKAYAATGKHRLINNVSVHLYDANPEFGVTWLDWAIERANALTPGIRVRQGEAGATSEMILRFGFHHWPFTEISQAKWDIRRMLVDHSRGVDTTVFQISDMHYDGVEGTFNNAKGLLRANEAREIVQIKKAFYAVQNVASVFDRSLVKVATNEMNFTCLNQSVWFDEYRAKDGTPLLAFWQWQDRQAALAHKTLDMKKGPLFYPVVIYPMPSDSLVTHDFYFEGAKPFADPVWVDLLSGRVYALPPSCQIVHSSGVSFVTIPVYDSPCLITERSALKISPRGEDAPATKD